MNDSPKQIAQEALAEHGANVLQFFLGLMIKEGRLLDQMADAIFMMMRSKMKDLPHEVQVQMGKLKGMNRIATFIMMIAPAYIAQMDDKQIAEGVGKILPYAERIVALSKRVKQ